MAGHGRHGGHDALRCHVYLHRDERLVRHPPRATDAEGGGSLNREGRVGRVFDGLMVHHGHSNGMMMQRDMYNMYNYHCYDGMYIIECSEHDSIITMIMESLLFSECSECSLNNVVDGLLGCSVGHISCDFTVGAALQKSQRGDDFF